MYFKSIYLLWVATLGLASEENMKQRISASTSNILYNINNSSLSRKDACWDQLIQIEVTVVWKEKNNMALRISMGVGVGVAIGVAMDNVAIGIAIGAAIGITFGSAMSSNKKPPHE